MNYVCKICHQKIESNSHFWSIHKIKIADYFHENEPRQTKDGESVVFKKEIEQYFETDFNDLAARNNWVKKNPELAKEYFVDLLVKRKIKKNWIYAPGETLLRLSNLPSILWFEKNFNLPFNEICQKLDFKIQYINKSGDLKVDWATQLAVVQDTREQRPLKLAGNINVSVAKLNFGDYAVEENQKITIERKSLNDFCNTISGGFERFQKELARCKKSRGYLVILVENSWNDFKSVEYLPQTKHLEASLDFLMKRARLLYENFECFQLVFVDGRKRAAKLVEFILRIGKKVKKLDLQYLVNKKIINLD